MFHGVTQMRGEAGQSPDSLSATGLLRGGGICGCSSQGPQHQQVLEEFTGPSGLLSSSSSSASASSLLARVRTPSSSFRWACSTSSVRRVKDWGKPRGAGQSNVSSSSFCSPVTARGARPHLIVASTCHLLLRLPHSRLSQRQAAGPRRPHLFNVEVGAGTCFVEVHAVLLGQLQERTFLRGSQGGKGGATAPAGTSATALTPLPEW